MNRLPKIRAITLVGLGALVIIATVTTVMIVRYNHEHPSSRALAVTTGEEPTFHALLPKGKSIDSLGGWQKLTPPNGVPFFTYVDTVDGVTLNISQQPLPESFKNDTDTAIAQAAKAYNATKIITVRDTVSAYIGTSAKGPQSVIFTYNGLLVNIKSQATLSDATWKQYITSLL